MPLGINLTDSGVSIDTPAAHAKGGQGGGNGGGGGNGNGGGAEPASGAGSGVGAANGVGPGVNNDHGAISAALGRGNAAHANEPALDNAAPNSQVGKVAAYRDPVGLTNDLEAELAVLEMDLETLEGQLAGLTGTDLTDKEAEIAAKEAEIAAKEAEITAAEMAEQSALEAAVKDPTYPGIAEALAGLLGIGLD